MARVAALAACGLIVALEPPPVAVFAWAVLARLTYLFLIGTVLRQRRSFGGTDPEHAWQRFRSWAAVAMHLDAAALVTCCWLTRDSLAPAVPDDLARLVGVALVLLGFGVKEWASRTLPKGAYYWRNFFIADAAPPTVMRGPYRWFRNPMYTVGYAHAWGAALVLLSAWGLAAAAVYHAGILVFQVLVEGPRNRVMRDGAVAPDPVAPESDPAAPLPYHGTP